MYKLEIVCKTVEELYHTVTLLGGQIQYQSQTPVARVDAPPAPANKPLAAKLAGAEAAVAAVTPEPKKPGRPKAGAKAAAAAAATQAGFTPPDEPSPPDDGETGQDAGPEITVDSVKEVVTQYLGSPTVASVTALLKEISLSPPLSALSKEQLERAYFHVSAKIKSAQASDPLA